MEKKTLNYSLLVNFSLPVLRFNPGVCIMLTGFSFCDEINGLEENDGVSMFGEIITKASSLPTEDGCKLLFATGFDQDENAITGNRRVKNLSTRSFADPDLVWSLHQEDGQKTLHHLNRIYGVTHIEALRRVVLNRHGNQFSVSVKKSDAGHWKMDYIPLGDVRGENVLALTLG
jgi:hypothetical protein